MQDWMAQGNCRRVGPGVMYPDNGAGVARAKKVCSDCSVKSPCLDYAIATRQNHGVWGGCSERQRRKIIRVQSKRRRVSA